MRLPLASVTAAYRHDNARGYSGRKRRHARARFEAKTCEYTRFGNRLPFFYVYGEKRAEGKAEKERQAAHGGYAIPKASAEGASRCLPILFPLLETAGSFLGRGHAGEEVYIPGSRFVRNGERLDIREVSRFVSNHVKHPFLGALVRDLVEVPITAMEVFSFRRTGRATRRSLLGSSSTPSDGDTHFGAHDKGNVPLTAARFVSETGFFTFNSAT